MTMRTSQVLAIIIPHLGGFPRYMAVLFMHDAQNTYIWRGWRAGRKKGKLDEEFAK